MDFADIIQILEENTNLERTIVSLKNNTDTIAYKVKGSVNISVEYTVDEETVTVDDVFQLCFVGKEDGLFFYINHLVRFNYVKLNLESVDNFSFS